MDSLNKLILDQGYKTNKELQTWEKCYWYLRFLVDSNRYGALSKSQKHLSTLQNSLFVSFKAVSVSGNNEEEQKEILDAVLLEILSGFGKKGSKKEEQYDQLYIVLKPFLQSAIDYYILAITIKELLLPTNEAVENVPTVEITEIAKTYGKAVLDLKKELGLATLIRDWDVMTESLSLNKERDLIVNLVKKIRLNLATELQKVSTTLSQLEFDTVISAICQEYERRVGQKRKYRAGNDLEGVTEFIFNYFGIKSSGKPEHFTTGIEVDNWIKDKKGWYVGVSLKRTLRERWKQTYTTEQGLMDRHKIKHVVHIINNDFDLSDDKITELGSYRHLFFLSDTSSRLDELQCHIAMKNYVFPMSQLIEKIKELTEV